MNELEQKVVDHLRKVLFILKKRLADQPTFSKLTSPQLNALIHLEKFEVSTVTELAQQEGISVQSMGVTVNSLKKQGLIIATTDLSDKRKTLLSLSGVCRAEILAYKQQSDLWVANQIKTNLNEEEQAALLYGVQLLERTFSKN